MPSLSSGAPLVTPPNALSTMNAVILSFFCPSLSTTSVRAKTVKISASPPLEIQIWAKCRMKSHKIWRARTFHTYQKQLPVLTLTTKPSLFYMQNGTVNTMFLRIYKLTDETLRVYSGINSSRWTAARRLQGVRWDIFISTWLSPGSMVAQCVALWSHTSRGCNPACVWVCVWGGSYMYYIGGPNVSEFD